MLKGMREGKLCPETLWSRSEDTMFQSLFLIPMHERSFNVAFIASKTFQNTLLRKERTRSKVGALTRRLPID